MTRSPRTDQVSFTRAQFVPQVELVSVAYRNRSFPEHAHDEYVIGAVTAGAELLTVDGETWLADAGSVLRLHPGQVHANASHGAQTLRYAVLYIPRETLRRFLEGACQPHFETPVVRHPELYRCVCETHAVLGSATASQLAQEDALASLVRMIGAHSIETPRQGRSTSRDAADRARRFIDDHLFENFGLDDLCRVAGLSPSHFIRVFRRATGLSPFAYRNQRRLFAARQRLIDGEPTAELAIELGYSDQSHFTRHFQRVLGTSPQRYARSVQSVPARSGR